MFAPTLEDRARKFGITQFTGFSLKTLRERLKTLDAELQAINASDEGGAIDGREWRIEAIADLEIEIERRTVRALAHGPNET